MLYLILYLISGLLTILAEHTEYRMLMYGTKVMLMPLLGMYFYQQSKQVNNYKFIYLALFFSWWGDIFLMFPRNEASPNAKLLFIAGLVSFLIGHLNYIIHFIKEAKPLPTATTIVEKPYLVLPFLVFICSFLGLLYPTLGPMKLPVTVYGIVITCMMMAAFNRKNLVNGTSFTLVFFGAVLFVFSDSCIALNLFYHPFQFARIAIMSTYIMAQLFIIKGILAEKRELA